MFMINFTKMNYPMDGMLPSNEQVPSERLELEEYKVITTTSCAPTPEKGFWT